MFLTLPNLRLLAFGILACFSSAFGQTFFISLFNPQWRNTFELTHSEIGALYSTATLFSGLLLVQVGKWLDHVPLVRFTTLSVLAFAGGCVLLANAPSAIVLLPAFLLVRLCGQGLMGHIAVSSMARFFERGRGRAISIATLGFPLGEAILPSVVVMLVAMVGWRDTWMLAAAVLLVIILPLLAWLPRQAPLADPAVQRQLTGYGRREVLRDARFWLLLPIMLATPFIVTGLFFHQATLAMSQGWSLALLASAFIAFAVSQTASSLLTGVLVDRFGARKLLHFFLLPLGVGAIALGLTNVAWLAFAYMALAGLSAGANGTLAGAIWAELYGTRHIGAIRAMYSALMVLSTAASPVLLGVLLDYGWSMPKLAMAMGGYTVLAGPLFANLVVRIDKREIMNDG
jgi:MFS family permease